MKPKEVIEEDAADVPTDSNDIMGWYDVNPDIGKMQKHMFYNVLDIIGEDDPDEPSDDYSPFSPAPKKIEPYHSVLDEPTILFLNANVLLDLGQLDLGGRFLYSTKHTVGTSIPSLLP